VSLPLGRVLPSPLEHGVHLHEVDASRDSIADALSRIRGDERYRRTLESNARRWFLDHLDPAVLLRRLLQNVGIDA
jgi:hypothetical protein